MREVCLVLMMMTSIVLGLIKGSNRNLKPGTEVQLRQSSFNLMQCIWDTDCPPEMRCASQECINACFYACGLRANCNPHNHRPTCFCPAGLTGNPIVECYGVSNFRITSCRTGDECADDRACEGGECVDPCSRKIGCPINTVCKGVGHRPACVCAPGLTGDPLQGCKIPDKAIACRTGDECADDRACEGGECVDPCSRITGCPINTICQVIAHRASCVCAVGLTGDPLQGCKIPDKPIVMVECTQDTDCPDEKVCSSPKCVDPCQGLCGINTQCEVKKHVATCSCTKGHRGNAINGCLQGDRSC